MAQVGKAEEMRRKSKRNLWSHYHLLLSLASLRVTLAQWPNLYPDSPSLLFSYTRCEEMKRMELDSQAFVVIGGSWSWNFNTFLRSWNNARGKDWAHALNKVALFFAGPVDKTHNNMSIMDRISLLCTNKNVPFPETHSHSWSLQTKSSLGLLLYRIRKGVGISFHVLRGLQFVKDAVCFFSCQNAFTHYRWRLWGTEE